jgi:hypothetical protein
MKRHSRDDERVTVYRVDPDPSLFEVVGERSHGTAGLDRMSALSVELLAWTRKPDEMNTGRCTEAREVDHNIIIMNRNVNRSSHFPILRKRNHPRRSRFWVKRASELGEIDDLRP